jgi:TolB-like protein
MISGRKRVSRRVIAWAVALGVILAGGGCAATVGQRAMRAMYEGDYARAVPLLTSQTISSPDDARGWARLGEAQFHTQQFGPARASFARAVALDDYLPSAYLFLGYIAEEEDSVEAAIRHYEDCIARRPSGALTRDLTKRIETLRGEQARLAAQAALARERAAGTPPLSESAIAIIPFNSDSLPDNLRPIGRGLAELLAMDLAKVKSLRVVERERVDRLIRELKRSPMAPFDSAGAPRLGRLLGAAHVIGGEAVEVEPGRLRVRTRLVGVLDGRFDAARDQVGELAHLFQMEKRILWEVLAKLRIEPTLEEKLALDQIPTESFVAYLSYARGLAEEEAGRARDAAREYERAVDVDPRFREAADRAREMSHLASLDLNASPEPLADFIEQHSGPFEWTERPARTDDRLGAMLGQVGLVPTPPPGPTDDPYTPPSTNTTIIIHGQFDQAKP